MIPEIKIHLQRNEKNPRDEGFYMNIAKKSIDKLLKLYSVALVSVDIFIHQDRVKFIEAIDRKNIPDWLVAFVQPGSSSSIFISDDKDNLLSDVKLSKLFTHEMAHLFTNAFNSNLPNWVKEGISVYLAGQTSNTFRIAMFQWNKITSHGLPFEGMSWDEAAESGGYMISGLLVLHFVSKYTWSGFLEKISDFKTSDSFFERIYENKDLGLSLKEFENRFVIEK